VLQGGLFGAACACACVVPAFAFAAEAPAGKFVCPPCGCDSDGKSFDAAGACPSCGMGLIPAPAPEPKPTGPTPPKLGGGDATSRDFLTGG
jgi:hypothetical protein